MLEILVIFLYNEKYYIEKFLILRSDKTLRKKQRTLTRLMIIMTSLVVISLLVTSFFVREYIKKEKMR